MFLDSNSEALRGPRRENRNIEGPLLGENSPHAVQQRVFLRVPDAGVAVETGVDFQSELIQAATNIGVPIGGGLRDGLLHGLVVALVWTTKVRIVRAYAPPAPE